MNGFELIEAERRRQVNEEGWSFAHDDEHEFGELANAAAVYALDPGSRENRWLIPAAIDGKEVVVQRADFMRPAVAAFWWSSMTPRWWPFAKSWWKPTPDDRIRELVKAGAFIAAEIDRLQRKAART